MSKYLDRECNILELHSEWIKDSEMRIRVRHFGKRNRIMVDVTELTPGRTSKDRAYRVARDAARRCGCPNVDCVKLVDLETVRWSHRLVDDQEVITKVRQTTFAFEGVVD